MKEVVSPLARFLGVPLAVMIAVTVALRGSILGGMPDVLLPLVAAAALPQAWLALALERCIARYTRALEESLATAVHVRQRSVVALRRLRRAEKFRGWLSRSWFSNAVFLAYGLHHLLLQSRLASSSLNPYVAPGEEYAGARSRTQLKMLGKISEFVYASGAYGSRDRADGLITEFTEMLPITEGRAVMQAVVRNTWEDGDGFLSTLMTALYVHLVVGLPWETGREIDVSLSRLAFDPSAFGWLGGRVLEAVIYTRLCRNMDADGIVAAFQPALDRVTSALATAPPGSPGVRDDAKWTARTELIALGGSEKPSWNTTPTL
ncbi:MAG TPA: hypothetical protein VFB78_12955 [Acidimicrobiales bacterium]|nr:hypothetical protein [Acidimicrobiales bacterium]